MADCIFCKIANGEIPSYKIYEDKDYLAFLDVSPSSKGQALVIPKKHDGYIFDLNDKEYSDLFIKGKKIAKAIDNALNPIRTCIVVEGFMVDHVHIRLHPCYERHLDFEKIPQPSKEEFEVIVDKIKRFL